MANSDNILLKTEGVSKRFPGILANDAISMDIRQGEIHCLLGENGAGKSTLAECLFGFYQPDAGQMYLRGNAVTFSSPREAIASGIGMVHQHFVLVPRLSVIENIVIGTASSSHFINLQQAKTELNKLCQEFDIELDLNARVSQLSVGEQQWVEILKVLYTGVELLILDEPTASLTPQEADKLFAILEKLKTEQKLSIIFITHKLREVMAVSDRVTVLRGGQKVDTVHTSEVSQQDLAQMMVGREVVLRVHKETRDIGPSLLEVQNLSVLGDNQEKSVDQVSFKLHESEILGLAGVAGNGQRELFEALVGVRDISNGQVRLKNINLTRQSPGEILAHGIGHIPADRIKNGLLPDLSVAENLILGHHRSPFYRKGWFLNRKSIQEHAQTCIQGFDIRVRSSGQPIKYLSGGNMQKVIVAREFSQTSRCLIAHQPTRGLDVGVIEYVHNQLLKQASNGMGILLISEDLDEIFTLADRIMVFFEGQVMGVFETEEIDKRSIGLLMAGVALSQGDLN